MKTSTSRFRLVFLLLAVLVVGTAAAGIVYAAELVSAEVVADTPNAVIEVKQGDTRTFEIQVSAANNLATTVTEADPASASVDRAYSIDGAGAVSKSSPSGSLNFWATPGGQGNSSAVTWTGAPTPYKVSATVSAASTAPIGDYVVRIGTVVDNGGGTTGQYLRDTVADTMTIRVVSGDQPPVIAADHSSVIVEAGDTATNTGTYSDPDGDFVTLSSDPAGVDKIGGTWSWSWDSTGASLGDHTVTVTAAAAGAQTSCTFTVTVEDTTAPALPVLSDITEEATGPSGAVVSWAAIVASDLVDGDVTATCVPASGSTFALGTNPVAVSVTDAAGNTATGSFDVTVEDTTAPALPVLSDITEEATGPSGAVVSWAAIVASDLVDGDVTATCVPASGSTFALGTNPVAVSVTDAAGNTATGSFDVTVEDTTAPALPVLSDITEEATGPSGAVVSWAAIVASDLVDGDVTATCVPASGSTFALGTNPVAVSVTDAAGNTATGSFDVTVEDTTAPALPVLSDITEEATGPSGAVVSWAAIVASDLVDGDVTATCVPASGSTFALGTNPVAVSVTDAAGNTATGSFDVTVEDTTAPALPVLSDITEEATGPSGAVVSWAAIVASDLVDGDVTATCVPASGSTFALGTNPVAVSVTDAAGNTATGSFDVTVEDTTAPALPVLSDITEEATGPSGAVVSWAAIVASDLVDGDVTATCVPASGSTFALGTNPVAVSVTDAAGNTATGSFDVTVEDTTAPALPVLSDITEEATGPSGAVVSWAAIVASDLVDGDVTATCVPASGSTFALGTNPVAVSVTDAAGNTATGSFDVTVEDTTAPALPVLSDITEEATGPSGAVVSWAAIVASDLVDGDVTATCVPASGSTFALGTNPVAVSVTDAAGNTATGSFTVTVVDTTPPTIPSHANITVYAISASGSVVTWDPVYAVDIVDGDHVPVTCTPASGSNFPIGTTTVTMNAVDAHGNAATPVTFTVSVVYNWNGFFQPIDNNGVFNKVKAGSAIPVKFSLYGDYGLFILAAGYPKAVTVPKPAMAQTDAIEEVSTYSVSGLKYDALADQYIYVWKTDKAWTGTCKRLDVKLIDGSVHSAYFEFVK